MNTFTRIAVVASVVAACWLSFTHAVVICDAPGTVCYNCRSVGKCAARDDLVEESEVCRNGQVCQIVGGVGQCVDAAGTDCGCDPFTLLCDAHDTLAVAVCISEEFPPVNYTPKIVQTCPVDEPCTDGRCAPITTPTTSTTTTPTTTITTPTTTTTTPTTTTTTTPTTTTTTPTTTTTTPTTTTTTTPTTTTTTPTTTTTTTTPTTTTTTTTPTTTTSKPAQCTAVDANKRFPHESDCKKFYTCRQVGTNRYGYVAGTCPSTYVFDSVNRWCDLPANVPGCTPASRQV